MKNVVKLLWFFSAIILVNCAPDGSNQSSFAVAEKNYESDPTSENAQILLSAYRAYLASSADSMSTETDKNKILEKALDLSRLHQPAAVPIFLKEILKDVNPAQPEFPEQLYELGIILKEMGKSAEADIYLASLVSRFPEFEKAMEVESMLKEKDPIVLMDTLAARRTMNPDQYGINYSAAQNYIYGAEAYAIANPGDPKTPAYLFDAAEMAKLLKNNDQALSYYDWLIYKYPDFDKTPAALFIKAFVLENELNDLSSAKKAYETFLEKYPDDDFADDARFSLENLGKTPDEVLKMIEANQAQ